MRLRLVCVGVAVAALGVSCGGDGGRTSDEAAPTSAPATVPSTTATAAPSTPTTAPPPGILGTWETVLPPSVEENGIPPEGRWVLVVTNDGVDLEPPQPHRWPAGAILEADPLTEATGVMRIALEVRDDEPCERSPEAENQASGKYRWRVEGDVLRFAVLEDGCLDRVLVLTTRQWRRPR